MTTHAAAEPSVALEALLPVATGRAEAGPPDAGLAGLRQRLADLATRCLGDVTVSFEAPSNGVPTARTVSLYLLALDAAPAQARSARVRQFDASLLVTTAAPEVTTAADDLAELAFGCLDAGDLDVHFEPLPLSAWAAFGALTRPSFTLRATVRRTRSRPAAGPPVTGREVQGHVLSASLTGVLLAQDGQPVGAAAVELPLLGRRTTSDAAGRFRFESVPTGAGLRLHVGARGVLAVYDIPMLQPGASLPPLRIDLSQP